MCCDDKERVLANPQMKRRDPWVILNDHKGLHINIACPIRDPRQCGIEPKLASEGSVLPTLATEHMIISRTISTGRKGPSLLNTDHVEAMIGRLCTQRGHSAGWHRGRWAGAVSHVQNVDRDDTNLKTSAFSNP